MKKREPLRRSFAHLPQRLKSLFWEHRFARLTWEADSELIISRILAAGDWETPYAGYGGPWATKHCGPGLCAAAVRD